MMSADGTLQKEYVLLPSKHEREKSWHVQKPAVKHLKKKI